MATVTLLDVENSQNFLASNTGVASTISHSEISVNTITNVFNPQNMLVSIILLSSIISHSPVLVNAITSTNYPQTQTMESVIPFMVSITNIGLGGYSRQNVPGIGVQIIGYSNYIL